MSDVILNDDDTISLMGTVVAPLRVDGADGVISSGKGAGFTFKDRDNPGQQWLWYAQGTRARLSWDGADLMTMLTDGNTGIGLGSGTPNRSLHVEGTEVHSGGGQGGFSFADRQHPAFVETPAKGERWVWYAAGGAAHLWSGKDILKIGGTSAQLNGDLMVTKMLSSSVLKGVDLLDSGGAQVTVWARDIVLEDVSVDPSTGVATNTIQNQISNDKPFANRALSHMAGDLLVVNRGGGYQAGVSIEGNPGLSIDGALAVKGSATLAGIVTAAPTGVSIKTASGAQAGETRLSGQEVSIAPSHEAGAGPAGTWSELHMTSQGVTLAIKTDTFPAGSVSAVGQVSLTAAGITVAPLQAAGHAQTWTEIDITESTIRRVTNTMVSGTVAKTTLDLFQVVTDLQTKVASLEMQLKKLKGP